MRGSIRIVAIAATTLLVCLARAAEPPHLEGTNPRGDSVTWDDGSVWDHVTVKAVRVRQRDGKQIPEIELDDVPAGKRSGTYGQFRNVDLHPRTNTAPATRPGAAANPDRAACAAALNKLRNEIDAEYGFRNGVPRVNLGPCGRFARIFHEQWNSRFKDKVEIAFIMTLDNGECRHVLVRLPDGNYYDGGNGIQSERALLKNFANCRIELMGDFDLQLLDKRSYGLNRSYLFCSNYSDEITSRLVEGHLEPLARSIQRR